ncbi:hypothetical protein MLD38_039349 [Melastoma candidum]|uniref:Uncharacterized protein n=1 Tax=Melastoma candidum TaxID=119954 RepID=A0ACB9L2I2_9MYRT|nr:hypothetical protein MLD38_039349 [Melastoma candidum]
MLSRLDAIEGWIVTGQEVVMTMTNFQMHRPGWSLGWVWVKKEVIRSMVCAEVTNQGSGPIFCCLVFPARHWSLRYQQDLLGPGKGYSCNQATIVPPSEFLTPDDHRLTQALSDVHILANAGVSLSSFYNSSVVPCPACSCGCQDKNTCVPSGQMQSILGENRKTSMTTFDNPPVQCTSRMRPIRLHWHIKTNYSPYWRVKMTITNFNVGLNYTQWTLVVQHPNLNNVTEVFSFSYKPPCPIPFNV